MAKYYDITFKLFDDESKYWTLKEKYLFNKYKGKYKTRKMYGKIIITEEQLLNPVSINKTDEIYSEIKNQCNDNSYEVYNFYNTIFFIDKNYYFGVICMNGKYFCDAFNFVFDDYIKNLNLDITKYCNKKYDQYASILTISHKVHHPTNFTFDEVVNKIIEHEDKKAKKIKEYIKNLNTNYFAYPEYDFLN